MIASMVDPDATTGGSLLTGDAHKGSLEAPAIPAFRAIYTEFFRAM